MGHYYGGLQVVPEEDRLDQLLLEEDEVDIQLADLHEDQEGLPVEIQEVVHQVLWGQDQDNQGMVLGEGGLWEELVVSILVVDHLECWAWNQEFQACPLLSALGMELSGNWS